MRVIAIDGPAGAGKSTVAKALAERLGLRYLDTGAMYRGVTFAALRRDIDPEDDERVGRLARELELEVGDDEVLRRRDGRDPGDPRAGGDAGGEHRGRQPGGAGRAAQPPAGRGRKANGGGVIEGRDIGSVVFPDAELKLYLTAAADVRAQRRHKEVRRPRLRGGGGLHRRARRPRPGPRARARSSRPTAPSSIDTTGRDVDDIVDEIMKLLP